MTSLERRLSRLPFNYRIVYPLLPAGVFLALDQAGASAGPTVAGTFGATALVFYFTRHYRLITALTVFGFVVGALAAGAGILLDSEHAYLASGPISDYLTVPFTLGSVLIGRPLVGGFTREIIPSIGRRLPVDAPVFVSLSVLWAGFDILRGSLRFYLLSQLSPSEYVIWSRLAHWPLTGLMLLITTYAVYRATRALHAHGRARGPEPGQLEEAMAPLVA